MNRWARPRRHLEPHVRPDEWETLAGECVQRQVLVPLELGLTGRVLSPGGLVDQVCAAIYQPAAADSDMSRC